MSGSSDLLLFVISRWTYMQLACVHYLDMIQYDKTAEGRET